MSARSGRKRRMSIAVRNRYQQKVQPITSESKHAYAADSAPSCLSRSLVYSSRDGEDGGEVCALSHRVAQVVHASVPLQCGQMTRVCCVQWGNNERGRISITFIHGGISPKHADRYHQIMAACAGPSEVNAMCPQLDQVGSHPCLERA